MDVEPEYDLRAHLAAELTAAMRRRDKPTLSALRIALARIANAEAVPVDDPPAAGAVEAAPRGVGATEAVRRELGVAEMKSLLDAEIDDFEVAGRAADAELLRNVLERWDGARSG